jgi:acetyl-CoA/propionyl-CoA carboxylase biotin carboxyl carrier protein
MEELGPDIVPEDQGRKMTVASARIVEALELDGVLRVRWAVNEKGGWWLLGISARLTTGYNLTERVFDVDLVDAQSRLLEGQPLGWEGATDRPERHGVQLRILHVDPTDGIGRPEGTLERLVVPEGAEVGVAEGQACTSETEPLLASIVVTGPTRHAALVKAKAALDEVVVEGVANNVEVLKRVVADSEFWRGRFDVHMVDRHLR